MTARCHNDSCTIAWSEVNTLSGPAFQADVRLNPLSLACDAEDGIGVVISAIAGNALSQQADGLAVLFPEAVVETLSGNPANKGVAPSADSGSTQSSDTYSWTNATGRDAIVLVSGELNFRYGVLEDAHTYSYAAGNGQRVAALTSGAVPFNAQIAMRFLADVGAAPTTSRKSVRVGIGGVCVPPSAGADRALVKTERVPFMSYIRVDNGATLNMKSDAFFEGPDQTVNVAAAPGVGGADLVGSGHELWNLQVVAVPL